MVVGTRWTVRPAGRRIGHLSQWIGREERQTDVVSRDLARKFAATFDLQGDFADGDPAPRLIHFCLAQPSVLTSMLGEDGHPMRGGFLPAVPLPRRMWAGGSVDFTDDLRIGEEIRRVSRIADVVVKEGRTGTLCFVTVEHTVDVDDRVVLRERQDIVYRGMDSAPAAGKAIVAAPTGKHRRSFNPTPPLLFRYSALTFNGHRIHYDKPYATVVEGYPGLVVHGPLQSTLLLMFAAEIGGRQPSRFSFRSQSPLFDGSPVGLHAEAAGEVLKLWTARLRWRRRLDGDARSVYLPLRSLCWAIGPERFAKAAASGAAAVILDLEDAVAAGEKDAARATLSRGFTDLPLGAGLTDGQCLTRSGQRRIQLVFSGRCTRAACDQQTLLACINGNAFSFLRLVNRSTECPRHVSFGGRSSPCYPSSW